MNAQRLEAPYENCSQKFYRQDQEFQRQFFHIYESRLDELGELIKTKVSKKYGELLIFELIWFILLLKGFGFRK